MKSPIWFGVVLLAMASCGLAGASDHSPCDLHPTQTGWHVFVDHQDRFCFEYPPKYHVAPTVFAPGVSTGNATRFIGRLTTAPSPNAGAIADDPKAATISPNARQSERETLPRYAFMPHMASFIITAAVEVAWTTLTPFTSEFAVVHSRLSSLDRTPGARPRTQRPRELSQRFWQVSIHSERSCRAFGVNGFRWGPVCRQSIPNVI